MEFFEVQWREESSMGRRAGSAVFPAEPTLSVVPGELRGFPPGRAATGITGGRCRSAMIAAGLGEAGRGAESGSALVSPGVLAQVRVQAAAL